MKVRFLVLALFSAFCYAGDSNNGKTSDVIITNLHRTIEVSYSGDIAVEDQYEIVHKGPEFKGEFSRLDRNYGSKLPAVDALIAILPAHTHHIYYRDQIGNISTSRVRGLVDRMEVHLRPRFPLLGGWRTDFILGYYVPAEHFLHSSGSTYVLKIPLVHPFSTDKHLMVIEKAHVKVILPEASQNIKIEKPDDVTQLPDTREFFFLDTLGCPTITFEKENFLSSADYSITITYEYNFFNTYRKPLLAALAIFAIIIALFALSRLDFSLGTKVPAAVVHVKED